MIPDDYQSIETRNGLSRGVYHNGTANIFCITTANTVIVRSYGAYSIAKAFADLQNVMATTNNLYELERVSRGE